MQELRLSQIWIYPIKSLGGFRVTSAKVHEKGLMHDRRWMLIDKDGVFITQRVHPLLALFKTSLKDDQLEISFKGDTILLPLADSHQKKEPINATVWNDTVTVFEVADQYSQWFSDRLAMECKLVAFPESNARPVDLNYQISGEHVSLADAYPFLIIGQRSLDHLNEKLEVAVPINRFRPNFVFTGGEPHAEDQWRNFKIGNNRFVGVKLCSRCVLTTVDQATAQTGKEPLATLSTYRKQNGKVNFGQNLIAIDHDEVFEGDAITF